ncbi:uncharacterized protein ACN427_004988 isoform 1-T1 [Glossina fuscipes fuscipes]
MLSKIIIYFLLIYLNAYVQTAPSNARLRRQIDVTLSAEHDDKEDETEIVLEAIANLWRSSDGNTQIEGSAKVIHRSNSFQDGPNDWRLGVRVVFS